MRPSRVRDHVLEDHERLRSLLASLERLARSVRDGSDAGSRLRHEASALLSDLAEHMRWEDLHLTPALEAADAWGRERAALLAADHREQREVLGAVIDQLADGERPPVLLAGNVLDFIELLRTDMTEEERDLLGPNVLRDDVVAIDSMGG